MSKQDLVRTGSMMAQEVLSVLHLPGSVALSRATEAALKKRYDQGVDALLSELEKAGKEGIAFGAEDHDEFVQILCRYSDAMRKGTSTRNLRLLARLVVGLKADGTFHYDEFGRWAGAIEGLTLNELELLAHMHILSQTVGPEDGQLWHAIKEAYGALEGIKEHDLISRMMALSRTGLVCSLSGFGSLIFVPAPSLSRLMTLAKTLEEKNAL